MKPAAILFPALVMTCVLACSRSPQEAYEKEAGMQAYTDTSAVTPAGFISSSAALVNKDTARKFIRTADMKFRVRDVRKATLALEDIAAVFEGFVTYTNLTSNIDRTETTPISADSSLETLYYTVKNDMVLRVPNTKLDSTLRTMAIHIDYLDYRTIKAQDVTLSLISNKMTVKRVESHSGRLTGAIDDKGKKLKETAQAEESLLGTQERIDNSKLSTLSIQDQIDFSTINLHIYQRQAVKRDLIENYRNIDAYQPGLFSQVWEAVLTGWGILKRIVIGLVSIWPIILVALTGWVAYKRYVKRAKKRQ